LTGACRRWKRSLKEGKTERAAVLNLQTLEIAHRGVQLLGNVVAPLLMCATVSTGGETRGRTKGVPCESGTNLSLLEHGRSGKAWDFGSVGVYRRLHDQRSGISTATGFDSRT